VLRLFQKAIDVFRNKKGFAPIETLVVMPILLIGVSAVINLAALGKQQSDLLKATHAATQAAAAAGYLSPGAGAAVQAGLSGTGLSPNGVTLNGPAAAQPPGATIQVGAQAAFNPPVPGLSIPGLGNVTIKAADREKVLVTQKDVTPLQGKGLVRPPQKQGANRKEGRVETDASASGGFWESVKSKVEDAVRQIAAYAKKVFALDLEG